MATQKHATKRVFFTKDDTALPVPNLIAHQRDSWREFVETGLGEIFAELNPIEDYTGQKLELRFGKYEFQEPKNSEKFAKENNITFDAPLHAMVELTNKVTGEVKEQEIYLGDYPWMTDRGTFVINGAERVVVSQLIRSAGVFFTADLHGTNNLYGAKVIPGRGAWLEFETAANGALYVKIDRKRKIPVTTLLRALGMTEAQMRDAFAHVDQGKLNYLDATLEKDPARGANDALIEVYRRLRPGDLATVDNARVLAASLAEAGASIISGGTDNHLMLVDVRPLGVNGKEADAALGEVRITVNKNTIPYDPEKPMIGSGIRVGTPAVTSRGMREPEMREIARLIVDGIAARGDAAAQDEIRARVGAITDRFPVPGLPATRSLADVPA